jgi:hypothetical protein
MVGSSQACGFLSFLENSTIVVFARAQRGSNIPQWLSLAVFFLLRAMGKESRIGVMGSVHRGLNIPQWLSVADIIPQVVSLASHRRCLFGRVAKKLKAQHIEGHTNISHQEKTQNMHIFSAAMLLARNYLLHFLSSKFFATLSLIRV